MLAEILGGLLGAALGVGLYRLGFYTARRTPRNREEKADTAFAAATSLTPQEWYNFLNYDGGEMQKPEK